MYSIKLIRIGRVVLNVLMVNTTPTMIEVNLLVHC